MKNLLKTAEFVIIGKAFTNIHSDAGIAAYYNQDNRGRNVLFKVEKVLKGELSTDTVYIDQYEEGTCSQVFEFGCSYIVFGYRIKGFVKTERSKNDHSSLDDSMLKDSQMLVYRGDDLEVKFLDQQTKRYPTIHTNICLTFDKDSKVVDSIKE